MQNYQVLARKWRPKRLSEIVGQPLIVRLLTNALNHQRFPAASLFSGGAGTGKTSFCRIIAKCLNCHVGISAISCEQCESCQAIEAETCLDFYEIDAASRTKVEDIRELLEQVSYPPISSRFKVYLIDEVHMLSQHSVNALLKTLEEPPSHTLFLLATTDPKRLPVTLVSRCLQFHLLHIPSHEITKQLEQVCTQEKISYEPLALTKLAVTAKGSLRDALSLLDQATIYGNNHVTLSDVDRLLGCIARTDLIPMLSALANHDAQELFEALSTFAKQSPDFHLVLEECIHCFHQLALAQIIPETLKKDNPLAPFVTRFTKETMQLYYQISLLGRRDLACTPYPQQGFEMTLLRMLTFQPDFTLNEREPISNHNTFTLNDTIPINDLSETSSVSQKWQDILEKLGLSGMAKALAMNCTFKAHVDSTITLLLASQHASMLHQKLKERIETALSTHFSKQIHLNIEITDTILAHTPLKEAKRHQEKRLADLNTTITAHPHIQTLIERYDASIDISLTE